LGLARSFKTVPLSIRGGASGDVDRNWKIRINDKIEVDDV